MKSAILFIVAMLLALGVVEGALRLRGIVPREARANRFFTPGQDTTWSLPDAELGWVNKPGVSRALEGTGALMTFWDDSRRAIRNAVAPPDHRLTVMLIGGSNLQGYGVADAETFASLLQKRFPDVWFENFGTGGYSTVQAQMLSERVLGTVYAAHKPDLVLLAFDDSHALRNVSDQSWIFAISDTEGHYVSPPHFRLAGDGLSFRPFETIPFWPLERHSAAVTLAHTAWIKSVAYNTASQAVPVTARILAALDKTTRAHGAAFAGVILEDSTAMTPGLFGGLAFPHKDCSGLERTDRQEYVLNGGHPNAKLHAHFAQCIGDWLEQEVFPGLPAHGG